MSAQCFEVLLNQMRNASGSLNGCKVHFYAAGTTSDKTVWTDRAKSSTAANPVTLSADGTAQIYGDGLYKIVVKTADDVTTIYSYDNIELRSEPDNTVYVSDYTSFAAAITAIGSSTKTRLLIDCDCQVSAPVTVTSNIGVEMVYPFKFTKSSTGTITFEGAFQASKGLYQVFSGFSVGEIAIKVPVVYPEWWGAKADGVTDDVDAINNALSTRQLVQLQKATYVVHSSINVGNGYHLKGAVQSTIGTVISYTGSGNGIVNATGGRLYSCYLGDFNLQTSTGLKGIYLLSCSDFMLENIWVDGFEQEAFFIDTPASSSGYSVYNRFYNCGASNCDIGFKINAESNGGYSANSNVIDSCRVNVCTTYGVIITDSNQNVVINSQIESTATGVKIVASGTARSDNNCILYNRFEGITTAIDVGTYARDTQILGNYLTDFTTAISDLGSRTLLLGGARDGMPALRCETPFAASTDGSKIGFKFIRSANGGSGTLGTNDPALLIEDAVTTLGNPTTILVTTGRTTGEHIRFKNASATTCTLNATGDLFLNGKLGINGVTPISKPNVTGSRGGNAALANLLTALANYGLITDSTT